MDASANLAREAFIAALNNAVLHGGRAEVKPVVAKLMPSYRNMGAEAVIRAATEAVEKVNSLSPEQQRSELGVLAPEMLVKERKERVHRLRELEGAGDGFTVRLAPYPSGALHIGNSRMIILNDEYARKYNGRLLLVFDDTIGSEEKLPQPESYELIRDGLRWLGVKWDAEYYKSDRLELFYEWAVKLIERKAAYVCLCSADQLRSNREKGLSCGHREHSTERNLELWHMMIGGEFGEGSAVLRARTGMEDRNPAFRDRVLCRISDRPHPRTGNRYRVWPMLEFSWAVDDIELGITHVIRGKELVMEDLMEKFIWNALEISGPHFEHFGLLRISGVKISKSKSTREVMSGEYRGWDDPRTWSLQSLRARGFRPEAIRSFMLSLGMSLADIEAPVESIYSENRRLLEPVSERFFFVKDPVKLKVEGAPDIEYVESYRHPDFPERGKRRIPAGQMVYIAGADYTSSLGSEIRLKDFCNVRVHEGWLEFTGRQNRDLRRIQWVPLSGAVSSTIVMPDGSTVEGFAEPSVREIEIDRPIQFERFGFVNPRGREGSGMIFYYAHD